MNDTLDLFTIASLLMGIALFYIFKGHLLIYYTIVELWYLISG